MSQLRATSYQFSVISFQGSLRLKLLSPLQKQGQAAGIAPQGIALCVSKELRLLKKYGEAAGIEHPLK